MKYMGIDLALNHSGAVLLGENGNEPLDYRFVAEEAKPVNASKGQGTRWQRPKARNERNPDGGLDDHEISLMRLDFMESLVNCWIDDFEPDFIGIEHYAYDATGAHQLGEMGGVVRLAIARRAIPQRWHDIQSVKMWAANAGNATKEEVVEGVRERWGVSFDRFAVSDKNAKTVEDLCDSYTLAQMVRTEHRVRSGSVRLDELNPKEIQVFNRITKAMPLGLTQRDWTKLGG